MTTPLVSVIIPVYNVEKYLKQCVDSVISQTYKNLEIILVDDGSTDNSGSICDDYVCKFPGVSVLHKMNGGQSTARNVGMELSKGDYIYFLDSDDYLDVNAIEILVANAEKNRSDLAFFNATCFYDGDITRSIKQSYTRDSVYTSDTGINMFCNLAEHSEYLISPCLVFFSRELMQTVPHFVEGIIYEDMIFTFELFCLAHKASYVDMQLYFRRYRAGSTVKSAKNSYHYISCNTVLEKNIEFASAHGLYEIKEVQTYLVRCASATIDCYRSLSAEDKKEIKSEFKAFKKTVLANNAFGNTALKMNCYGYVFWFVYKCFDKVFGFSKG